MKRTAIKITLLLVSCFIIGIVIGETYKYYNRPKEDFEIYQSYKTSFNNGDMCHINVIVHVKEYDIDEMFEQVRQHYNTINGEVDKLDIRLFNSKKDFEQFNLAGERTFYSDDPDNTFLK